MNGKIEEIGGGYHSFELLRGRAKLKETSDVLYISNGKLNLWVFSLFTGYRQLGTFEVDRPHDFKEGQDVWVTMVDGKITKVEEVVESSFTVYVS